MRWFRRRSAEPDPGSGGSGLVAELLLVVAQDALRWRSPERFGEAAYYVRAYRPGSTGLPVVIIADTGNAPPASSSNRFDEIAVLTTQAAVGIPPTGLEDLGMVATWIDCRPAHGPFGETYNEMSFGEGRLPKSRYLRQAEVEEIVGGPVEPLTFEDCAPSRLRQRGVRVQAVR